jgi:CrcB protein
MVHCCRFFVPGKISTFSLFAFRLIHYFSAMQFIWVFIGGGLGSITRYAISIAAAKAYVGHFPLGTFLSNVFACLILGTTLYILKDKIAPHPWLNIFITTGFCGGFSTFSTWSKETLDLLQQGHWGWALANIGISLVSGIGLLYWLRSASEA